MEWANVSDVETLRSMLASQQQQLQQLQQQQPGAIEANTGSKRKATSNPTSELTGSDSAAEEAQLDKDDDMWEPADDSDYDDAPKKKQKSSKKGSSKKSKQQDEASYGADAPSKEQEKTSKAAAAALKSIKSAINQQMAYKKSLKHGSSRVSLELPCLSESIVSAMLGPELMSKASNGKKQLQLKASLDDLGLMYGGWSPFCKSLRYGATLELVSGLTFTFNKGSGILKVHGSYTMRR